MKKPCLIILAILLLLLGTSPVIAQPPVETCSVPFTVFLDLNGDALHGLGEPGIAGVEVTFDHAPAVYTDWQGNALVFAPCGKEVVAYYPWALIRVIAVSGVSHPFPVEPWQVFVPIQLGG